MTRVFKERVLKETSGGENKYYFILFESDEEYEDELLSVGGLEVRNIINPIILSVNMKKKIKNILVLRSPDCDDKCGRHR